MTRARGAAMTWVILAIATAILALGIMAALPAAGGGAAPLWLVGLVGVAAWIVLVLLHEGARRHYDDLKLLQAALDSVLAGQMPSEEVALRVKADASSPTGRLAELVLDVATRRVLERAKPDRRLTSVIAALKNGVVVVTETGLVSLVNAAGRALLGGERVAVGTSVYAALDRDGFLAASAQARAAAGAAVEVTLTTVDGAALRARIADFGEHRGAVLTFPAMDEQHPPEIEEALDLHDRPPSAPPPGPATMLSSLPVTVLDTETTGLDVATDRIVSVGAVRVHGPQVFRSTIIDRLVDPGRRIPQQSIAIHGITDAMVAGHPHIGAMLPELLAMVQGTVVVGHNIGFDLAILRRSAREAGGDWTEPQWLDTVLLAAAFDPEETDLNLDALATRLGVNVAGRHTALGDALVTAEIWVRLLPRLERRGVRTLGEAMAFSRQAKDIVARQRAAGW